MTDLKKVHLGCGDKYLPGYVHVDLDKLPHVDYVQDIRDLSMFEDNSLDEIYSCHAFEYFDRQEVPEVLAEWKRALKPGGILRLAVPDFEGIVKVYLKYNDLEHQGILGPLFGRWPHSEQSNIYHRTVYDFKSLAKALTAAGFDSVERYEHLEVMPEGYDDYAMAYVPHMDSENGILISLNVQCRKK